MPSQISAYVSYDFKNRLERYSHAHGIKKGYIIEKAIDRYLQAAQSLPESLIIESTITLTPESYDRVQEMIAHPPAPNPSLKAIMRAD